MERFCFKNDWSLTLVLSLYPCTHQNKISDSEVV